MAGQSLEYGVDRSARRIPAKWWISFVVLLTVVGVAIWQYPRGARAYWQWRALSYSPPPQGVVFERMPSRITDLRNSGAYVYATTLQRAAVPTFESWQSLHLEPALPEGLFFSHRLVRPDGQPRLVVLGVETYREGEVIVGSVYRPASYFESVNLP